MKAVFVTVYVFTGFVAALTAGAAPRAAPSLDTEKEAISKVLAPYPKDKKEIWPISGYPRYTRVRPLQQSTFASLRGYFSSKQRRNVDQFLEALTGLINTKDQLAKKLDIHEQWWPPGIDLLKVDALLTQDLLTGRTDNPDKMSISTPKSIDGKLEVTIQEAYTETGQDRVLGRGRRTSRVTLILENNRWVIDEITTTTTDSYGETTIETLSQRLQDAIRPLRTAERAIERLPQTLEVRKGVKVRN